MSLFEAPTKDVADSIAGDVARAADARAKPSVGLRIGVVERVDEAARAAAEDPRLALSRVGSDVLRVGADRDVDFVVVVDVAERRDVEPELRVRLRVGRIDVVKPGVRAAADEVDAPAVVETPVAEARRRDEIVVDAVVVDVARHVDALTPTAGRLRVRRIDRCGVVDGARRGGRSARRQHPRREHRDQRNAKSSRHAVAAVHESPPRGWP
jgi:hypothetical protein